MHAEPNLKNIQKEWHGSLRAYLIGFAFCLILTSASFLLAWSELLAIRSTVYFLVALALIQAACQAVFFLHLGQEAKPRWESLMFYFMLLVLFIIVVGSMWIIFDLNDRVMNM